MRTAKDAKLLDKAADRAQTWGDILVSVWVLFIAFAICGIITLAGFPVGWKEFGHDYSAATAGAQSGASATLEASALRGIGR